MAAVHYHTAWPVTDKEKERARNVQFRARPAGTGRSNPNYLARAMALLAFRGFLNVLPLLASRLACSSQSC